MGKGSKPSTPEASAQENALADISIDIANEYKDKYRPLEGELLEAVSRDRTNVAQGRSNVDTQRALAADNEAAIARAGTSGGLGSNASLSNYDAGATGGALAASNQNAFAEGQRARTAALQGGVGAVQGGQDVAFAGVRDAASVANQNTVNQFAADQTAKLQRAQLAENMITGFGSGYAKGKGLQAQRDAANELSVQNTNAIADPYFQGPMQLSAPSVAPQPGFSVTGMTYGRPLGSYNPISLVPQPGFGIRKR